MQKCQAKIDDSKKGSSSLLRTAHTIYFEKKKFNL